MSEYKTISLLDAQQLLQDPSSVIIDMRDPRSYQQAHLPRALAFHDKLLLKLRQQGLQHAAIVVYCYHGNSSKDLAKIFSDFGYSNVYSLDGGFAGWQLQQQSNLTKLA